MPLRPDHEAIVQPTIAETSDRENDEPDEAGSFEKRHTGREASSGMTVAGATEGRSGVPRCPGRAPNHSRAEESSCVRPNTVAWRRLRVRIGARCDIERRSQHQLWIGSIRHPDDVGQSPQAQRQALLRHDRPGR